MHPKEAMERAYAWHESPNARPGPVVARAVAYALAVQLQQLKLVATRQVVHVNNGLCPDTLEGPDVRDPDCPACQILLAMGSD